jgi:hypothetical protein
MRYEWDKYHQLLFGENFSPDWLCDLTNDHIVLTSHQLEPLARAPILFLIPGSQ